ncbi:MAG: type II toxin-antitoxin system HicA family toxin [Desulfobacula sp.]|nr:type II toxin-antitoxin system HicA family toxin [Desulfobacula sp.]MBT3486841.1 type II toxin-antitoxin system HicA family toxin [Desulfobacula sp.]MBT3806003.1 type II toxin-antitoxin system HicA family toxin [Desulfobacula sp.]MBT4200779.1 type II toxin-antitoxin system HicA family toxin [Desulfobacula sp.]MBT4508434.1 type II toxin-antitoxin system HicA family toxin [Desulfobacula sp.]
MNMDSRQIIKELKKAGFVLVKVSGDRHKFKHENGKIVIVPHPQKDLPIGTARNIFKMAELKWRK